MRKERIERIRKARVVFDDRKQTPRVLDPSARLNIRFGNRRHLEFFCSVFFFGLVLAFCTFGLYTGSIRDAFPSRWSDAGAGTVEVVEQARRNNANEMRITFSYTDAAGNKRTLRDRCLFPAGRFNPGDTVDLQRYAGRGNVLRIKRTWMDNGLVAFLSVALPLVFLCGAAFPLFDIPLRAWIIRLLEYGELRVGRILVTDLNDRVRIRRAGRPGWEEHTVRVATTGEPPGATIPVLYDPDMRKGRTGFRSGLLAYPLPYGLEYDPERGAFVANKRDDVVFSVLLLATAFVEIIGIGAVLFWAFF